MRGGRRATSSPRARSPSALAAFEQAEVTAAPVYDIDQFIADPHVQAREIVAELPDAEMGSDADAHGGAAALRHARRDPHAGARRSASTTRRSWARSGLSDDDLAGLRERKVI